MRRLRLPKRETQHNHRNQHSSQTHPFDRVCPFAQEHYRQQHEYADATLHHHRHHRHRHMRQRSDIECIADGLNAKPGGPNRISNPKRDRAQ